MPLRTALAYNHQHADPPHTLGLLRVRRERPRRRAAQHRHELAARHSITSSARASSIGGTVRPSALAALRSVTIRTCRNASSAGASSVLRRLDYQKMETMAESARRVGSLSPSLT